MAGSENGEITINNLKEKITFGVELVEASIRQLQFLQMVDRNPLLYGPMVKQSIRRYETLWLPLVAGNPDEILAAPLDIEWIWHCHMLAPLAYEKDCMDSYGTIIKHQLQTERDRAKSLEISKQLWVVKFPDEPFENGNRLEECSFNSKLLYNLEAAIDRQKVFYYQVSLPHYRDKHFLKQAVARYQKFLYLKHKNPGAFLVPCYDIDLIWHAHQSYPHFYKEDTVRILGKTFNHDDTVNDRSPGSKLANADKHTRELWKDTFGENFSMFGAMYRGDIPSGKLTKLHNGEVFSFSTKIANVLLEKVILDGLAKSVDKFKLKVCYLARFSLAEVDGAPKEKEGQTITSLRGPCREWQKKKCKYISNFSFDTQQYNYIKFKLIKNIGFMCFGHTERLAENVFHLLPVVESLNEMPSSVTDTVTLNEEENIKVTFTASIESMKQGSCVLLLKNGNYETRYCIMPEHIEQMWGPVPLARLPTGRDNNCIVASHK